MKHIHCIINILNDPNHIISFFSSKYVFTISHYDVLGVSRTATKSEIRAAYLQKTKEVLPMTFSLLIFFKCLFCNGNCVTKL